MDSSKIMIVEDNTAVAEDCRDCLEELGYRITSIVASGEESIGKAETERPDAVLMDIQLRDEMDGIEAAEQIYSRFKIPVVFLSAYSDRKLLKRARQVGSFGYLIKPFEERDLFATLEMAIYKAKAEKALVEKTILLDNILRNAQDLAITTTDIDFRITYYNPMAEKLFGYTAKEVIGKTMQEMHTKENVSANRFEKAIEQVRLKGEYRFSLEQETGYGKRYIDSRVSGIFDQAGELAGYSLFSQDVTNRKQTEKIMLKASRMEVTATLAGGIAHDFNNLMIGVLGNASLLRIQYSSEPEAAEMLNTIEESARRAGELAQQLLAFARGGKYQPNTINLNDIIQETLRLNDRSFPPRIRIERDIEPELFNIIADPAQMNQVVMNLCINSVEAIEKSGRIIITTRNIDIDEMFAATHPVLKAGRYAYLSVEDTGCGMDKTVLAKVFEPFFSTKFLGRGLGLAAVYGIVKNHDGYISVYSEVDRGAAFKIYLPASKSEVPLKQIIKQEIPTGTETLLIIDDEEMILKVTRKILEYFGYRVLPAHNGQEAVDIVQSFDGEIHLALLDMSMPILGGAEAFPLIKEARPQIKVILCSGYKLDAAAQALLDTGADSFLQKPFRMEQLIQKIRKILDSA